MNPENFSPSSSAGRSRLGMAIASLVLGIVGLCLSVFLVGALLGLAGLALGLAHIIGKRERPAMAWWGISLSTLSIVAAIGLGVVYLRVFTAMKDTMSSTQTGAGGLSDWEGVLAPEITVTNLEGRTIRLSELQGKRVVLDFWATWCGPCVKEIPEFIRLRNEIPRDELVIVGISEENAQTLKPFVKKKEVNYDIASATDLPDPFRNIQAIPTTFFIDRKGVFQSVAIGGRPYAQLKELAMAKDFEGEAKQKPVTRRASGIKDSDKMLNPSLVWSTNLPGATAICSGDWDGDGTAEILVVAGSQLHLLELNGTEKSLLSVPEAYAHIACGRDRQKGARLLGFSNWGRKVAVVDKTGKELWNYSSLMGVNGAHWGDLDGDGKDELIVGMNGFGGLQALSAAGKSIWHASLGNVWSQAVISAGTNGGALVFASEAGGTIRVFDGKGHAVRTLRPAGAYYTKLAAAVMDHSGQVQVLALGKNMASSSEEAIAFDSQGQVIWESPVSSAGGWVQVHFACGDFVGDGNAEWAFLDQSGDLILVTAKGQKLAAIPNQSAVNDFAIVSGKNKPGLLVVLRGASVQAFSFN